MRRALSSIRVLSLAAAVGVMGLAPITSAALTYSVTGYAVSGDTSGRFQGISSQGTYITGWASSNAGTRAETWDAVDGISALEYPAGEVAAHGLGVNNSGLVVGYTTPSSFSSAYVPTMWQNGNVVVPAAAANQSAAQILAVNDAGLAVGSATINGVKTLAEYTSSAVNPITASTVTMLDGTPLSIGYAVNQNGLIGGNAINGTTAEGFIWNGSSSIATSVGFIPNGPAGADNGSTIDGINDNGDAVGFSNFKTTQDSNAMFYSAATQSLTAINTPVAGDQGQALAINDSDTVIGLDTTKQEAFIWNGSTAQYLNDLLTPNSGWTISIAYGIDNNGDIVGLGQYNGGAIEGFVMTPQVPEPATAGLALTAGAMTLLKRRRA